MLPTFLGIGSQRCGTTWLYEVLSRHPGVFMSKTKELHFFDQQILFRDLGWYEAQFRDVVPTIRGEITPSYSTLLRPVVQEIGKLAPDLKLLLTLRHPVDRAWSNIKMLEAAWLKRPVEEIPEQRFLRMAESVHVTRRSDYERTIDVWTSVFGEDALLVTLFEEQTAKPQETLEAVLRHIGADPSWLPPDDLLRARVWSGPDVGIPDFYRWHLARLWQGPVERLNRRLDGRIDHWVSEIRDVVGRPRSSWENRAKRGALRRRAKKVIERGFYATVGAIAARRLRRFVRRRDKALSR